MSAIHLDRAEAIVKEALRAARERKLPPMSVVVVDAGGHLKFAAREDGAGLGGVDIAAGKARSAVMFGCSSRQIADALAGNPLAGQSVLALFSGRIMLLPGAVLLTAADGTVVGAVGAAGGPPDEDEGIAKAGAAIFAGTGGLKGA
jgi:uncharacterized protein GlcG (DUF336 family)